MFNLFRKSSRGGKVGKATLMPVHEKSKENAPDWYGYVTIKGTEYKISGWNSETRSGNECISISIQKKWKR
tara:strand:- start:4830 stop:5042 length:213 start_codon:yes stop_codon:yes gene_type:complete